MAESKTKSRTFRRIKKKAPANRILMHFVKRKPAKAHCSVCGAVLKGVPTGLSKELSKMSKTQKRPERPFGGVLCSKCARKAVKTYARSLK